MRVALAQLNTTIGDFQGNLRMATQAIQRGRAEGCDLVVLPELALCGYPPMDLVERPSFVRANQQALQVLAAHTADIAVVVGFVDDNPGPTGRDAYNAAAFLQNGEVRAVYRKMLLPNYDVFDEARVFEANDEPVVVEVKGRRVGLTICEDAWNDKDFWVRPLYRTDPVASLAARGIDMLVNISASPFVMGKHRFRVRLLGQLAHKYSVPVAYCNAVGGNDSLIFDGRSLGFDARGDVVAEGKAFEEDVVVWEPFAATAPAASEPDEDVADAFAALQLGLRDYVRKCGFKSVVLGLSGGIDSALTAVIAARALGPERVTALTMPSQYSSAGSISDSKELARNLGIELHEVPIGPLFDAYRRELAPLFGDAPEDTTEENIQARIRGNLLMAWSNKRGAMVMSTGNKSELAVGYCTLYGDMSGGLAVIADVPKTLVYDMARYVNSNAEIIPQDIIDKPPSAELRPDQTDQDSLPPYDVLDAILDAYIVGRKSAVEIEAMGFDAPLVARVLKMIDHNEYKRRQGAPGLKVTEKAFGSGRRYPITQKFLD